MARAAPARADLSLDLSHLIFRTSFALLSHLGRREILS
jgi:hypothetical protein